LNLKVEDEQQKKEEGQKIVRGTIKSNTDSVSVIAHDDQNEVFVECPKKMLDPKRASIRVCSINQEEFSIPLDFTEIGLKKDEKIKCQSLTVNKSKVIGVFFTSNWFIIDSYCLIKKCFLKRTIYDK